MTDRRQRRSGRSDPRSADQSRRPRRAARLNAPVAATIRRHGTPSAGMSPSRRTRASSAMVLLRAGQRRARASWSPVLALPVVGGLGARRPQPRSRRASSRSRTSSTRPAAAPAVHPARRDGGRLATFYEENRIVVPLDQISPMRQQAIVAIEDSRFYEHGGVDVRGTAARPGHATASRGTDPAGRLHPHPAVREERADQRGRPPTRSAQAARAAAYAASSRRAPTRSPSRSADQGPDPRALPQHRLLRRRLPTASRLASHRYFGAPPATSPSRRRRLLAGDRAAAGRLRPDRATRSAAGAARHRPQSHARAGLHHQPTTAAIATSVAATLDAQVLRNGCSARTRRTSATTSTR